MIPEIGHFALILSLALSVLLAVVPAMGIHQNHLVWIRSAQPLALGQFFFVLLSFIALAVAFARDDFSVVYVAANSNSQLPMIYKICAVWGAHEGSLLLWALVLSGWTAAVAVLSRDVPRVVMASVLATMGFVGVGFLLFLLMTSNPFLRYLPQWPLDGRDLNPLLQDPGLIIHPPMLYMGYVGFSVPFAFAMTALISGQMDTAWAKWARTWTNVAWAFLTVGIVLGSWWAYYELGWGGWWFWDPVENASFMPWLVGTALVHSLNVTQKRGLFKAWTLLLAIFAFALSLLGTFLVRSGVLTSVHAFASDPERGVFILIFLGLVVGGSLGLFAWRAPLIKTQATFSGFSRETFLLLNNLFLVLAALTVLIGTLFPLIADVLHLGKVSVGPPYFNLMFVPMMAILAILVGIGVNTRYQQSSINKVWGKIHIPAFSSVALGVVFPFFYDGVWNVFAAIAVALSTWIILIAIQDIRQRYQTGNLSMRIMGMHLAHIGFAFTILGVSLTSQYSQEKDVRLSPGQYVEIPPYRFEFKEVKTIQGPNYEATKAIIEIFKQGHFYDVLKPQKRFYPVQQNTMTETAIEPGLWADLYVALGEPLGDDAWAVRVHHKPFVRFMWLGGLMIACGALICILRGRVRE